MGASGNAASKSDVTSLQSTVKTLQTKVKALESTTIDDKAMKALASNINYLSLKEQINMGDLSTEVLKSPGKIADAVVQSFSGDRTKMEPIATSLADNGTFAKTLADKLTDASSSYKGALRGEKGETGDLSTSKESVKSALYDKKYTLWCADGDVCQVPVGTKALNLGVLGFSNDWSNGDVMGQGGKNSQIVDDRGNYKKLMLVGNNSGGGSRQVGVWDDLSVAGNLSVGGNIRAGGEIVAPNGVNLVHGGSKISDRNGNLHLDTDDWVVFPSARIKLGVWEIDASDGNIRFRKDGDGQMFVIHNKGWHNGSTWVHGNYHSAQWNKWL